MPIASAFCAAPSSYILSRKLLKPIAFLSLSACGESPPLITAIPGAAPWTASATWRSIFA
jgi:hypothetical protein